MQWIALSAWYVLARFARVSPTAAGAALSLVSGRASGPAGSGRTRGGPPGEAVTERPRGHRPARPEGTAEAAPGAAAGRGQATRRGPGPRPVPGRYRR